MCCSAAALAAEARALHFTNESYNHCKAIGANGAGADLLRASRLGAEPAGSSPTGGLLDSDGIVVGV